MSNSHIAAEEPTWDAVAAFDVALYAVRRRVLALTCAIAVMEYLDAWCEACELQRQIERTGDLAAAIPDLAERADARRRLADVRAIARDMLAIAPLPSARAILQGRASSPHADRSLWEREEAEWLATRRASGNARPATMPSRITRHPETRPDSPHALHAATTRGSAETPRLASSTSVSDGTVRSVEGIADISDGTIASDLRMTAESP